MRLVWSLVCLVSLCNGVAGQLFGISTCNKNIPTKYNFDLNQYLGKWYEIRRYYPIFFEFGLKCGVAEYALKQNGNIEVRNTGTERLTGVRQDPIIGEARVLSNTSEDASKLYVSFGMVNSNSIGNIFEDAALESGNYWVMDTDYVTFAIVYSCINFPGGVGRTEIVWLLGRLPELDESTLDHIYSLLEQYKIKTKYLLPVEQTCGV